MTKRYMVIGAGPGIGAATARRFAREGFAVSLVGRDANKLEQVAEAMAQDDLQATKHAMDATDAAMPDLIRSVSPDVLHYNAAVMRKAGLEAPLESFNQDLAVNIGGALAACQAAWPLLHGRGGGTVLLTGGALAMQPSSELLTLSIGKAAIRSLAQALFGPGRAEGIHVATVTVAKAITPGSSDADGVADLFWDLHAEPQEQWRWEAVYR